MSLTRRRAKRKFRVGAWLGILATSVILVAALANESRADIWTWLTDLVADRDAPELEASLGDMELPANAIVTAPGQARSITLGRDLLELYPNTAVTIEHRGQKTTVHLLAGTVRAKVAKRKSMGLFEVQTPLLVGAVKGTVFEVSSRDGVSALSVYEGRVSVKAVHGIGGLDVNPGKTATVSSRDKGAKVGDTPKGGAAAAAKQASKAAGFANNSPPANRSDSPDNRAAAQDKATGNTSSAAGSQAASTGNEAEGDDTERDDKEKDKDKKDKKDKHGKSHKHGHENDDNDQDGDDDD